MGKSIKNKFKHKGWNYIVFTTSNSDINEYKYTTAIYRESIADSNNKVIYKCASYKLAKRNHKDFMLNYSYEEIVKIYESTGGMV